MRIQNPIKLKGLHCQAFTCHLSQKNIPSKLEIDIWLISELIDVYNLNIWWWAVQQPYLHAFQVWSQCIVTVKEFRAGDEIPGTVPAKLSGC